MESEDDGVGAPGAEVIIESRLISSAVKPRPLSLELRRGTYGLEAESVGAEVDGVG